MSRIDPPETNENPRFMAPKEQPMSSFTPTLDAKNPRRVAIFNSVGNVISCWELDVEAGTLERRGSLTMPSVVQYGWAHPSGQYLYVTTTDSERGSMSINGSAHYLVALRVDAIGNLSLHGEPQRLRQRAVHNSLDREGRYALTCYTAPSHVTVHAINPDGTLGAEIEQGANLDLGFFCHQILPTPSNHSVVMVFRGHNPSPDKPDGVPGSIKVLDLDEGRLISRQDIAAFGRAGYGYGPRHVSFHPTKSWVYVVVELQNQLHMHNLVDERLSSNPIFTTSLLQKPAVPDLVQIGGAIHVHPRGHVVYASNRCQDTPNRSVSVRGRREQHRGLCDRPRHGRAYADSVRRSTWVPRSQFYN
jgi:6-phosphogluconolactonase (cycloisomerase 2 family)